MALSTPSNLETESKDGILETELEKAAKRREYARKWRQDNKARKTEYCRKWREKFAREHPEKDAAQKKKAFDALHQLQKIRILRETPEERVIRLKKISEYKRQTILMETPEQKAARLEKNRLYWQKMKLNETPEQRQARIEREKRYKQKTKLAKEAQGFTTTKHSPETTMNEPNCSSEEFCYPGISQIRNSSMEPEVFGPKTFHFDEQTDTTSQQVFIITEVSKEPCQTLHSLKNEPEDNPNDLFNQKLSIESENLRSEIKIEPETPEAIAARCAEINESERINMLFHSGNASEHALAVEASENFRLEIKREGEENESSSKSDSKSEYYKVWRKNKILRETPEETQARRARDAEVKRKRWEKLQSNPQLTEEERAKFIEEQRNIMRERDRINRIKREAKLTPEQKEARRIKMNEQDRLKRERLKKEMPEKAAAIRARINARRKLKRQLDQEKKEKKVKKTENIKEYRREYRRQMRLKETEEEKAARRLKDCEAAKINRQKRTAARQLKRQKEKEEKKNRPRKKRPTKSLQEKREQKRKSKARRYAALTPEQKEVYRLKRVEGLRRFREKQRKTQTAEQKAEYTRKDSERTRLYRQKQRALFTLEQRRAKRAAYYASLPPEKKEARELKKAERNVKQRLKMREKNTNLTPEEKIARNVIKAAHSKLYRQRMKEKKLLDQSKTSSSNQQPMSLEGIKDGSGTSHDTSSRFEISNSNNLGRTSAQIEKSKTFCLIEQSLDYMKAMINHSAGRDEHFVYGEHIAQRIRISNRSEEEIYVAKQLIDKVLQNLLVGNNFHQNIQMQR